MGLLATRTTWLMAAASDDAFLVCLSCASLVIQPRLLIIFKHCQSSNALLLRFSHQLSHLFASGAQKLHLLQMLLVCSDTSQHLQFSDSFPESCCLHLCVSMRQLRVSLRHLVECRVWASHQQCDSVGAAVLRSLGSCVLVVDFFVEIA